MVMEIFLVCSNRSDDQLADPVKTCDSKMHFLLEDAEKHLEQVTREVGPHYGIYKGTVETTERVK